MKQPGSSVSRHHGMTVRNLRNWSLFPSDYPQNQNCSPFCAQMRSGMLEVIYFDAIKYVNS